MDVNSKQLNRALLRLTLVQFSVIHLPCAGPHSITLYILSPRLAPNGSGPGTPTGPCSVPIKVGAATVEDGDSVMAGTFSACSHKKHVNLSDDHDREMHAKHSPTGNMQPALSKNIMQMFDQ